MALPKTPRKAGRPRLHPSKQPAVNRVGTLGNSDALAARYSALGASAGYAPLSFLHTRRFLLGQRRFGKTILMAGQRNTAYLDFDGGSNNRALGAGSVRFPILNHVDLKAIMEAFRHDMKMHRFPFEHVIFDTIDTMRQVIRDWMTMELKGQDIVTYGKGGKGYDMLTRRCLLFFNEVTYTFRVGWTVIGHLKYRSLKDEEGDEVQLWAPAVNPGLSDGIAQLADLLMEIRRVSYKSTTETKAGKKKWKHRFMLETITPPETEWTTHELGTRVPMQSEFEIPKLGGIEVLETEYKRAVEAERKNW